MSQAKLERTLFLVQILMWLKRMKHQRYYSHCEKNCSQMWHQILKMCVDIDPFWCYNLAWTPVSAEPRRWLYYLTYCRIWFVFLTTLLSRPWDSGLLLLLHWLIIGISCLTMRKWKQPFKLSTACWTCSFSNYVFFENSSVRKCTMALKLPTGLQNKSQVLPGRWYSLKECKDQTIYLLSRKIRKDRIKEFPAAHFSVCYPLPTASVRLLLCMLVFFQTVEWSPWRICPSRKCLLQACVIPENKGMQYRCRWISSLFFPLKENVLLISYTLGWEMP